MSVDATMLMYGAIFLAVIALVEGVILLLFSGDAQRRKGINRRMRLQASGRSREDVLSALRRNKEGGGPVAALDRLLAESGSETPVGRLILTMALLSVALWFGLATVAPAARLPAIPAAGLIGVGVPLLGLMRRRRKRVKRFGEQLPDALDMVIRSLRAGHPILASLGLVAREMPDPVGSEFGIVVDEITYGLELTEALENLRTRIDHPDLHYMVVAINIQQGTGGNLADVLANLAALIRDRLRLYKKASALSAEGRLAAMIIGVLPFVIAIFMTAAKGDYYTAVASDPLFLGIMAAAVVTYVGAMFVIYKVVQIEV